MKLYAVNQRERFVVDVSKKWTIHQVKQIIRHRLTSTRPTCEEGDQEHEQRQKGITTHYLVRFLRLKIKTNEAIIQIIRNTFKHGLLYGSR